MIGAEAVFAAVDLGASSGRVILGRLRDGRFALSEVSRFANGPIAADDGWHWDADYLLAEVRKGLDEALRQAGGHLDGIGIDTWGVDYGRLDTAGELIEQPFNYRDARTQGVPERFFERIPADDLYRVAGLQVQPFNTVFQFVAAAGDPRWADVAAVLLMPDLLAFRLTGRVVAEVTNASTTGLLDCARRRWAMSTSQVLEDVYDLPFPRLLPELVEPGTVLGNSLPGVLAAPTPVIAVGSHDTASAVVAVPAAGRDFAYVSSGTWSLVGLELDTPVLTEESRAGNFTNELGVDGTVRYLKNVMGLWVLSESRRVWAAQGRDGDLDELLAEAGRLPAWGCIVDVNDERLLPPGDMPARLLELAAESGQRLDDTPAAITRCIVDSLAVAYAAAIRQACRFSGRAVDVVHIVGGGSQNALLCQLTAEITGLPVIAGPAEGTALGNLLVQARAVGALTGDLAALRRVARDSSELTEYRPGALAIDPERLAAARRHLPQ